MDICKANNIGFITSYRRHLFDLYVSFYLFIKYSVVLISRKISFRQYVIFFRRLIIFNKRLKHNKVVKINKQYKIHFWLPVFPSKPFFQAVEKFLIINGDPPPVSVVLSMTKACTYKCPHCYQKKDTGKDLPREELIKMIKEMQDIGIAFIDIEGGEPLLRFDRLLELVRNIDERSEIWVNTTGYRLTEDRARKLKEAGVFGVMISLHHWSKEKHDEFTGVKGSFDIACSAMKIFQRAGIVTVINCCPSSELIEEGGIEKMMDLAKEQGCSLIELIHEKPAGGWMGRKASMGKDILKKLYNYHLLYNTDPKYKDYPSLSVQVYESSKENFGCTAGGIERFYVNAYGEVQPCEFLNVSFGNVEEEGFLPVFRRMREYFKTPGTNWLCCTECQSIEKIIKEKKIKTTPLDKKITISLVRDWDRGEKTPLYREMKLYENKEI